MTKHTKEIKPETPKHLRFMRDGPINMRNGKPYRTIAQKKLAEKTAKKTKFGNFKSTAPLSFHA